MAGTCEQRFGFHTVLEQLIFFFFFFLAILFPGFSISGIYSIRALYFRIELFSIARNSMKLKR